MRHTCLIPAHVRIQQIRGCAAPTGALCAKSEHQLVRMLSRLEKLKGISSIPIWPAHCFVAGVNVLASRAGEDCEGPGANVRIPGLYAED
jgi:hypothetical protein